MTARQLEEFIGVIETAERLWNKNEQRQLYRKSHDTKNTTSTDSLWSYPTDIFTPKRSPRGGAAASTVGTISPAASPLRGLHKGAAKIRYYPKQNKTQVPGKSGKMNKTLYYLQMCGYVLGFGFFGLRAKKTKTKKTYKKKQT